jgi:hypothetical protein
VEETMCNKKPTLREWVGLEILEISMPTPLARFQRARQNRKVNELTKAKSMKVQYTTARDKIKSGKNLRLTPFS